MSPGNSTLGHCAFQKSGDGHLTPRYSPYHPPLSPANASSPSPEPTAKFEELPANLAGVAGHSGQLYTGPQNRAGRGRDYLVVKRKIALKDESAGSEVLKLRPVVHGTQYDVSSMQREKYLALDPDSEDGYWYVAKILGLRPSGHESYQYTAYISWPAFDEYDA